MSDRPTPWAVLGVAEGADLEACAAAFRTRLAEAAPASGRRARRGPAERRRGVGRSWSRPGAR